MRVLNICLTTMLMLCSSAVALPQSLHFRIRPMGTPAGGTYADSRAGINNSAQVAGNYVVPSDGYHAYRWAHGVFTPLGPGIAYGLNDFGEVVGVSASIPSVATLWTIGGTTPLGSLSVGGSSQALGINDVETVVGVDYGLPAERAKAFRWTRANGMQHLPSLSGTNDAVAWGINNQGQIVGHAATGKQTVHAVIWQDGIITDLGAFPGDPGAIAYYINADGQTVGQSIRQDGTDRAFLWRSGVYTDLGSLGLPNSAAIQINTIGDVVGYAFDNNGLYRPWLYSNGTLRDLNDLLSTADKKHWVLAVAMGINDKGQITGYGTLNGVNSGFVMTPKTNHNPCSSDDESGQPADCPEDGESE